MQLEVLSQPLSGGLTGNFHSVNADVDDSGDVIVFSSAANDLVSGDSGPLSDIFIYTRQSGGLTSITLGANDNSGQPIVSADGRYVLFVSSATNLVTPDDNGSDANLFLFDRQTEELIIGPPLRDSMAVGSTFTFPEYNQFADISGDGSLVVFNSSAAAIGADDSGSNLFLWRPGPDAVEAVLPEAEFGLGAAALSADGRFLVFGSASRNLLEQPLAERRVRFYFYEIDSARVELLLGDIRVAQPSISADGRHVAFLSTEEGGQPIDSRNIPSDLFTIDTQTNQVVFVSADFAGASVIPNPSQRAGTRHARISGDGNRIAFASNEVALVPDDNNGAIDIFVWDRNTGQTTRLTEGADRDSFVPSPNFTGDMVAFTTAATNLLEAADTNTFRDVLVWREDGSDEVECESPASGVLESSSGVSISLQGSSECLGSGLFNYGTPDSAGIRIAAARGRPELQLVPENDRGLPANDLIFFTYPAADGQLLYATDFVSRDSQYNVHMTFKTRNAQAFELYELVVFEPGERNRRRIVYREQDTQWVFSPQDVDAVLNLRVPMFEDANDDSLRSEGERSIAFRTTLFRCGNQDGMVRSEFPALDGVATYFSLEPGFYQLVMEISRSFRFSTPVYDDNGNQTNTIRQTYPTPSGGRIGYTQCTDFTDGTSSFAPIGIVRRP